MTTKNKKNNKNLYKNLKKITIITIIICALILLSSPVLVFLNSKYKIIKNDEKKESSLETNDINSEKINDIF